MRGAACWEEPVNEQEGGGQGILRLQEVGNRCEPEGES
jgi:hypothetical protein